VTDSFSNETDKVLATLREISTVIQSARIDSLQPARLLIDAANHMSDKVNTNRCDVECRRDRSPSDQSHNSTSLPEEFLYRDADESVGLGVTRGVLLVSCLYLALATSVVTVRFGSTVLVPAAIVMFGVAFLVHRLLAPLFAAEAESPRMVPPSPDSGRHVRRFFEVNISPVR
jgi:hypothetical protein